MRVLEIYRNGDLSVTLKVENREHYGFRCDDNYCDDSNRLLISLTLPKMNDTIGETSVKSIMVR